MEGSKSMKHGSFPNCWACNSGRGRGKSDWPLKSACCLVSRNSMYEKVPKKRNLASLVSGTAFEGSVCILVQMVSNRNKVGLELLPAPHQGYKATLEVY